MDSGSWTLDLFFLSLLGGTLAIVSAHFWSLLQSFKKQTFISRTLQVV